MPNRTQGWQPQQLRKRRVFLPYLILLLGLCFTVLVYYYFSKLTYEQDQSRFQKSVQEIDDKINLRVQTSVALLRAATGLFAASETVKIDEFDRFVKQIELHRNYPGIHGIGFSRRFSAHELPALEARMRKSGFPEFRVWPDNPPRDEYFAIVYMQPQNTGNRLVMGYDMFTDPVRREAMEDSLSTHRYIEKTRLYPTRLNSETLSWDLFTARFVLTIFLSPSPGRRTTTLRLMSTTVNRHRRI
jgi:CHASE1-domain containing sensor protein